MTSLYDRTKIPGPCPQCGHPLYQELPSGNPEDWACIRCGWCPGDEEPPKSGNPQTQER